MAVASARMAGGVLSARSAMAVPCARMAGGVLSARSGCFAAAGEVATAKAARVVALTLADVTADARCLAKRDGLCEAEACGCHGGC